MFGSGNRSNNSRKNSSFVAAPIPVRTGVLHANKKQPVYPPTALQARASDREPAPRLHCYIPSSCCFWWRPLLRMGGGSEKLGAAVTQQFTLQWRVARQCPSQAAPSIPDNRFSIAKRCSLVSALPCLCCRVDQLRRELDKPTVNFFLASTLSAGKRPSVEHTRRDIAPSVLFPAWYGWGEHVLFQCSCRAGTLFQ